MRETAGLVDDLLAEAKATALLSGARTGAGLRTALATLLSVLAALALHLDDPWWAGITGVVIVQSTATATWSRAIDRVLGTMVGAAIGYAATALVTEHLLLELVLVATTAFTVYGQARVRHGYAVLLGGVTIILVLFGSLETPGAALHLAVYRGLEIIVGVAIATAVDVALAEPSPPMATAPKPGIWSLPVDLDLAAVALSVGVAVALIPLVWGGLDLPGLDQTPITGFVILTSLGQAPLRKAVARTLGCLLGGLYGLAMMRLVGDAFLPWLTTFGLGIFLSAALAHGDSEMSYVGLQAGIAIVFAMVQGPAASPDFLAVVDRLAGILGGIALVGFCHPVLTPLIRAAIGAGRSDGSPATPS